MGSEKNCDLTYTLNACNACRQKMRSAKSRRELEDGVWWLINQQQTLLMQILSQVASVDSWTARLQWNSSRGCSPLLQPTLPFCACCDFPLCKSTFGTFVHMMSKDLIWKERTSKERGTIWNSPYIYEEKRGTLAGSALCPSPPRRGKKKVNQWGSSGLRLVLLPEPCKAIVVRDEPLPSPQGSLYINPNGSGPSHTIKRAELAYGSLPKRPHNHFLRKRIKPACLSCKSRSSDPCLRENTCMLN